MKLTRRGFVKGLLGGIAGAVAAKTVGNLHADSRDVVNFKPYHDSIVIDQRRGLSCPGVVGNSYTTGFEEAPDYYNEGGE